MSERFEDISRTLADPLPRRRALRVLAGAAVASAAAAVVHSDRADARVCNAGETLCGRRCCAPGSACAKPGCCCPRGTTPCGRVCCDRGVACADSSRNICGCPPGTTPCGSGRNLRCCPAGTACQQGCPRPRGTVAKHC